MFDNPILKRNFLALAANNSELSARIGSTSPLKKLTFIKARNGVLVPALKVKSRLTPLHSTFNPLKEGERLPDLYSGAGYLVIFGIGAGYHINPFLKNRRISNILIIEKNPAFLRRVMENIDLRALFMDPRVQLLVNEEPIIIKENILTNYFPAIAGDLKTLTLRPLFDLAGRYYEEVLKAIRNVISKIADDYTVQVHFGKKWFINSLFNLPRAEKSALAIKPVRKVLITGAGPSLESQLASLREMRKEAFLIASDTSLPSLMSSNIVPDTVISIDCQQVSYHHFLQGMPSSIPLVLDLASPPLLTRLTSKIIFFASAHPFSQFVSANWRRMPYIDTSGGNVSHAAVSLAHFLGAQEINLFGVDYSYPQGKAYARSTYLYPFFRSQENRIDPLESLFFSFIMRNGQIIKEKKAGTVRYITQPMISYRQRLERALADRGLQIFPPQAKGLPIEIKPVVKQGKRDVIGQIFSAGAPNCDWKSFLTSYLAGVKGLPKPVQPLGNYFRGLSDSQRTLWVTLYPAAAALKNHYTYREISGVELLLLVREWTDSLISRYLA